MSLPSGKKLLLFGFHSSSTRIVIPLTVYTCAGQQQKTKSGAAQKSTTLGFNPASTKQ
jgi:hypothetical protein